MKKLIIQLITSSILLCNYSSLLFGQEEAIQGRVTTFDSIPLIGASIKVKSTKKVVLSDTLGRFIVFCLPKDKLKVTARGFLDQNVKIRGEIKYVLVNLKLKTGTENRELAIGYGHVKDGDKLYAISSVTKNDMDFSQYNDIYELIIARFSGIQIIGGEIVIRGVSTTGSNSALLVVNGTEVDENLFRSISTKDIKSINVLKGAAASVYGIGGANGVIIVETKSGGNN